MKRFLLSLTAMTVLGSIALSSTVWADASRSRYFTDMNSQSYGFWAIDEVDELLEKGVVTGVGDNKFAPQNLMERGDFVLMLENAFHYPTISTYRYNFADVSQEDYYYTAINNARGNGILDDTPVFNPQNPIKRIDAFNMIYKTMNLYGCVGSNGSTDVSSYNLLNTTDKIAVGTITKMGIISGYNGELKPNDTVTRAEMAVMLSKAIEIYEERGSESADTGTVQEDKPVLSDVEENIDKNIEKEEKITETYVAENGENAVIDGNEIAVSSGDGAVARGTDTTLKIEGSKASTAAKGSKVISVTEGAEAELINMNINSSAQEGTGVYVDENSSAKITASKVFARYEDSRAVDSKGRLEIADSTVQGAKSEALRVYGGTNTDIVGSDLITEGSNGCIVVENLDDAYEKANINLTDVTFKGDKESSAILVKNARATVNLKNVVLEGVENIIDTQYIYSRGIKDTEVDLVLDGQKLEGEITADDRAIINLKLTNGANFKGVINYSNTAKEMNLEISSDSLLELTDICYIDALIVDENLRTYKNFAEVIDDNGSSIYYNADNPENDYLNDDTYSLQNGGVLTPIEGGYY